MRLHGLFDPFNPLGGAVIVFANAHNHRDILMPHIHQIVGHLKRGAAVVEPHAGMHGLGLIGIGVDKGNVFAFDQFVKFGRMGFPDQNQCLDPVLDQRIDMHQFRLGGKIGLADNQ